MTDALFYKTATELSSLLEKKEISSVELIQSVMDRTHAVDSKVQAFLSWDEKDAIHQAEASDQRRQKGESLSLLDGIPVGIKDNMAVKGQPLSSASRILEKFISPYESTATQNLRNNGAVVWGRLNMDEFAMGSSTEHSSVKTTSNPWNLDYIPGGSSGGSTAAVAAGETILALGSDTGGSIRQPASLCGVVGMKPSYGLVSRYGLAAFASSLDQIGPCARSVEDAALLLQAIAGHDAHDSTSFKTEIPDYRKALSSNKKKWRIGIPKEYFGEGIDSEVRESVEKAIDFYRQNGAEIVEISLPGIDMAVPVYYIIASAEASSNLARYDGVRYTTRSDNAKNLRELYFKSRSEGFGSEVKRRILLGSFVLSSGYYDAYYLRAQKVRTLIRNEFMKAFEDIDVIVTPTSPFTAFKKGEKEKDPLAMYLADINTISVNLAGLPGISVPCGFSSNKLPIGVQFIGKPFQEADLLCCANEFDSAHDFSKQHPEL